MFKELKVQDMMLLLANLKGVEEGRAKRMIEDCLETVNLSEALAKKVGSLSGGMLRRLGVAQTLLNNPAVVIFDEPTTGLDPEERLRFKNLIRSIRNDRIIIISTHIVEDIEAVCDTVVILNQGRILRDGSCAEIQAIASGKVYLVPEREKALINGTYFIQKQTESAGIPVLKILSAVPQKFDAATPSVEDGYICELKGI